VFLSLEEPYNEKFTKAADHFPFPGLYNPEYLQCDYAQLLNIAQQKVTEIKSTTKS